MDKRITFSLMLALSLASLALGHSVATVSANPGGLVCDKTSARFQETVNCQIIDQNTPPKGLTWWYNGNPAPCSGSLSCGFIMPLVNVLIIEVCTTKQPYPCMKGATSGTTSEQVLITLKGGAVLGGTNSPLNAITLVGLFVGLVTTLLAATGALILRARKARPKNTKNSA